MRKIAGALFLVGAAQFIIFMIVAETLYDDYSAANNYISDLGVGPSANIFNLSVILFGIMVIGGAYCLTRVFQSKLSAILFLIAGIGAMGVGIFPENYGTIHSIVSLIVFLFGGLSAISVIRWEKSIMGYISAIMGVTGIIALILFITGNYLGIGKGGMERMIAYPLLLWAAGFGGYLIGSEANHTSSNVNSH